MRRSRDHPERDGAPSSATAVGESTATTPLLREQSVTFGGGAGVSGGAAPSTAADDEATYVRRRMRENPMWSLDRGSGRNDADRLAFRKASLLSTGTTSTKSAVRYEGVGRRRIRRLFWRRDPFTSALHAPFPAVVAATFCAYFCSFALWGALYYLAWRYDGTCFIGIQSYVSAFLFAIETQQTIGFGNHAIDDCWGPAWMLAIHQVWALLLEAAFVGIVLAKISHPKGRGNAIIVSESACLARRDGAAKFMFRVADIRRRTSMSPRLTAQLYTWGARRTAEGEPVPIVVQDLPLNYSDASMLLPVVVEHTVDERSPLYGHTRLSLRAASAEVVVTYEGTSDVGGRFVVRRSYLPDEIHFGCVFATAIRRAGPGETSPAVDLSKFHDVVPQRAVARAVAAAVGGGGVGARAEGGGGGGGGGGSSSSLPAGDAAAEAAARAVVLGGARRLPTPRLLENTLALSDELCIVVSPRTGRARLCVRVGDTYPSQMANVQVAMWLYRYKGGGGGGGGGGEGEGEGPVVDAQRLALDVPEPVLRYPVVVSHDLGGPAIAEAGAGGGWMRRGGSGGGGGGGTAAADGGPRSPIAAWATLEGLSRDVHAEIVVTVSAQLYAAGGRLCTRSRVYPASTFARGGGGGGGGASDGGGAGLGRVRHGWAFAPCVEGPTATPDGRTRVQWSRFHAMVPLTTAATAATATVGAAAERAAPPPLGERPPLPPAQPRSASVKAQLPPPPPPPHQQQQSLRLSRSGSAASDLLPAAPGQQQQQRRQSGEPGGAANDDGDGDGDEDEDEDEDDEAGEGPEWDAAERRGSVIGNNPLTAMAPGSAEPRQGTGEGRRRDGGDGDGDDAPGPPPPRGDAAV